MGKDSAILAMVLILALVVIALVALPWVFIALVAEQAAKFPCFPTEHALMSEVYDDLKTGDLLLFTAATHNILTAAATREFFSHGAFLIREGGLVYTSEASPGSHLCAARGRPGGHFILPEGAAIAPLLLRVKHYNGLCFLLKLSGELEPPREEMVKAEADRLAAEAYPYPGPGKAVRALLGGAPAARHCFQHVAHLLDTAGLTSRMGESGLLRTCHSICGIPGASLSGGRRYSPPRLLVYDVR